MVTLLGYEPFIYQVSTEQLPPSILFKMRKKAIGLQEVVIEGKRDEEWYIKLDMFKQNFLGRSALGRQCKLLNPEALTIVFDVKAGCSLWPQTSCCRSRTLPWAINWSTC